MRNQSKTMALGGVTAALAVVIMCMGTLIPLATYVCPVLCALLLSTVFRVCGEKIAWVWYAAVAILSLLLCPDKEAAGAFAFLGYYPVVKPKIDKLPLRWFWKMVLFNGMTFILYGLLIYVFGLNEIMDDLNSIGFVMGVVTLMLGNITFLMLDRLLGMRLIVKKPGRKHG